MPFFLVDLYVSSLHLFLFAFLDTVNWAEQASEETAVSSIIWEYLSSSKAVEILL